MSLLHGDKADMMKSIGLAAMELSKESIAPPSPNGKGWHVVIKFTLLIRKRLQNQRSWAYWRESPYALFSGTDNIVFEDEKASDCGFGILSAMVPARWLPRRMIGLVGH